MVVSDIIRHGSYTIQYSPGQPFHFEKHPYIFRLSNVLSWLIWACNLIVQATIIRSMSRSSATLLWNFWAAWVAEICLSLNDFGHGIHLIYQFLRKAKVATRPHYRLLHDSAPTVDVFVPCCGEPVDVLVNTIASAAGQDYPASKFRVVVLDDGHDDNLRKRVNKLNEEGLLNAKIVYCSRTVEPGVDSFFKAGNLRYGIKETARMTGGEFIASIDADMIPDPEWLRRMVPHFILDSRLAMLNQPQHYYNVPENDPLAERAEFDIWYTLFETANDRVGEAMCQGSGFLVRRTALEEIGGWPLAHTGEDVMCSLKLHFAGWKLGYIREYLQHGMTPESLQARMKQKVRWAADHLEFIREYGLYTASRTLGALTYRELTAIPTTIGLIVMPIALLTAVCHTEAIRISPSQYAWLRAMLLATFFSSKLNEYITYRHVGLTRLSNYQSLNLWYAPYATWRFLSAILPVSSGSPSFFVTGTFVSPINERSSSKRAGLLRRITSNGLPMNITYVTCCLVIVMWSLWQSFTLQTASKLTGSNAVYILMFPGPIVKLVACLWKAFIPVLYMIWPPSVLGWREYLESDSRGVLQPKKSTQIIMDSHGSCRDTGVTGIWWDTLEIGALACSLWAGF